MQIADEDFVQKVGCDIEHFLNQRHNNGVLLFPPVNSYRRFLIHQTCENYRKQYDISTFSVGQGVNRRTVVCFRNQLLDPNKFTEAVPSSKKSKQSPLKNWRSGRKVDATHSLSDSQRSTHLNGKMGVEKNYDKSRINKSHSVDLYRPPALRNYESVETSYRNSSAVAPAASSGTFSNSTSNTSLSCNNSPIHSNENNCFGNTVTSKCIVPPKTTNTMTPIAQPEENEKQRSKQTRRERRPDRVIYVPRARRSQTTPPIAQSQSQTTIAANTVEITAASATATATGSKQLAITSDQTTSVSNLTSTKADEFNCSANVIVTTTSKKSKTSSSNKERKERSNKKSTISAQIKTLSVIDKTVETNTILSAQSVPECVDLTKQTNCDSVIEKQEQKKHKLETDTEPEEEIERNTHHLQIISNFENQNQNQNQNQNKSNLYEYIQNPEFISAFEVETTNNMNTVSNANKKYCSDTNVEAVEQPNLLIENVISNENARNPPKCDIDEQELQRASKEINRSNRRIFKQTFVSDVLEIPERINENVITENVKVRNTNLADTANLRTSVDSATEEEDDWETMFDESGECLDPKIMEELTASVGKVKIELPKMDYNDYLTKQTILNDEEFPHVLEVSNFPVEFKNQDLLMVFQQYKGSGFDIKWVDDTHALAVFSSSRIAAEVLSAGHPFVIMKPLSDATAESRLKAKKCAASLQPYRQRPETCAALARRLVTGALGVRLKTAAAERENEKRVLREAKERKLLAAKQRDEAWDN